MAGTCTLTKCIKVTNDDDEQCPPLYLDFVTIGTVEVVKLSKMDAGLQSFSLGKPDTVPGLQESLIHLLALWRQLASRLLALMGISKTFPASKRGSC